MISPDRMALELAGTLHETDAPWLGRQHRGKVRDSYTSGGTRTIVTTDRLSAFDRMLGTVPFKGQALSAIANYWFESTQDVVPNHLVGVPDSNVVVVRECQPIALEFVVRAYITGVTTTSLWFNYERGQREMAGHRLPDGLVKNQKLERPILTPTTKFEEHDRNLSRDDAIEEGLLDGDRFDEIAELCVLLFERGTSVAADRGLILVDTKYEFGTVNGQVVLMDEIHTPDCSRYWHADSYDELLSQGEEQRALDKEPLRIWFVEQGFRGEGEPPRLTDEIRIDTATRYIELAEQLTQVPFEPTVLPARERVTAALEDLAGTG